MLKIVHRDVQGGRSSGMLARRHGGKQCGVTGLPPHPPCKPPDNPYSEVEPCPSAASPGIAHEVVPDPSQMDWSFAGCSGEPRKLDLRASCSSGHSSTSMTECRPGSVEVNPRSEVAVQQRSTATDEAASHRTEPPAPSTRMRLHPTESP